MSQSAALPSLELNRLEVRLGPRRLVLDRNCVLQAGRMYLVVGRSGSGKSSLVRALLGFGELTEPPISCRGQVTIVDRAGGRSVVWNETRYDPATRQQFAFLPQAERLGFIDALSVVDNLELFSHRSGETSSAEIERLAEQFHLRPLPSKLASASGGERIRLSAIRGLVPRGPAGQRPQVVIADEPTAGLDRTAAAGVADLLIDLARAGDSVLIVITHEPGAFLPDGDPAALLAPEGAQIFECHVGNEPCVGHVSTPQVVCRLLLETVGHGSERAARWQVTASEGLSYLGALALSPLAFLVGLFGMHRPRVLLRQALGDAAGPGTQAFSLAGCLLIAGTVAYFIFERMPKPELVEPLLLPEVLAVTGHTLVRVVLPLGACSLVTAKLGAAQAARIAAAVRGGLLETLAMAGWRVEAYALVPCVLAQCLAMAGATAVAVVGGVLLAATVYVAGHADSSLPLIVSLLSDGLDQAPQWWRFLLAKIGLSSFVGGTIAALCGTVPSRAEDDVARAVHRTLLWSVLAVIAVQCALVLWEFAT